VIAVGAADLLRQPTPGAADGTAVVLGPAGADSSAASAAAARPAPAAADGPPIAVIGDAASASSLVRSLAAAGLRAGVSAGAAGKLGPVSVPTVLYGPTAGAAASAVAAVLETRMPETTLAPMPSSTGAGSAVVVLLPAATAR
jgi:hypothetical protein